MKTTVKYLPGAFLLVFTLLCASRSDAGTLDINVKTPSVTVKTNSGTGSGTIFVNGDKNYVLTAGHVVSHLRHTHKTNKEENGISKEVEVVHWDEAHIMQTLYQDGKDVERSELAAKVVAYSAPEDEGGNDLAVLEILKKNHLKEGAKFLLADKKIEQGDHVIHIGSLYGDLTGSYIEGTIARLDYKYLNNAFNVVSMNAKPGSSGGGVFRKDGEAYYLMGIVTRGDNGGTIFVKPPEVIREFLKDNGFDDNFKFTPKPIKETKKD